LRLLREGGWRICLSCSSICNLATNERGKRCCDRLRLHLRATGVHPEKTRAPLRSLEE
jgi:hypothetical protein